MKTWNKYILIGIMATMVIAACTKEEDDNPSAPSETKTSQLIHTWIMTNAELNPPIIPIWGAIPDCEKDNELTFKEDGTGVKDHGALKCNPLALQAEDFTWTWENGQSDLKIIEPDTIYLIKDVSINSTKLTGTISVPIDSVNVIDAIATFTRK